MAGLRLAGRGCRGGIEVPSRRAAWPPSAGDWPPADGRSAVMRRRRTASGGEQQAAGARVAAVEAEAEPLQVGLHVLGVDAALMGAQ